MAALILAGCSSTPAPRKAAAPATTTVTAAPAICPLTGAPVPGGGPVPGRPALAVKVDNYPAARPQSGVDKADVVFEEPVEGGITRFVAVYQCQQAALVGPIRSARNIDIGILGQLGSPLLAHVGGIIPVLDNIANSPLVNVDLGFYGSVNQHPPGRQAPYDTYASTSAMWNLKSKDTTVPSPLFTYASGVPAGDPISAVYVPFSGTSNVVWLYDAKSGTFKRYYGMARDLLANGVQNSATNVVVQFVHVTYGPWLENSEGGLEVQANLYQNASGQAEVFRNGVEITGTWHRSSLGQPTQFVNAQGQPITLAPGTTWVELVPDTVRVTATPASVASTKSTAAALRATKTTHH
ncbi:MAG TPA: DUF3048 domain-containing protein [Acidimicrobiales bacterium]|nr:DUF3048 domain-containing protein [Acidimicrobiales bacterium]